MNTTYISGKIAGLPVEVYTKNFEKASILMAGAGFSVLSPLHVQACPHEDCNPGGGFLPGGAYLHAWQCYLKYDIIAMLDQADSIAMLPNWWDSRGAELEKYVAFQCGLKVYWINKDYSEYQEKPYDN